MIPGLSKQCTHRRDKRVQNFVSIENSSSKGMNRGLWEQSYLGIRKLGVGDGFYVRKSQNDI